MEEQVFFERGAVKVTSTRVVFGGKTFATRNIGSVIVRDERVGLVSYLLVVLGLLIALPGLGAAKNGAVMTLMAGLFLLGLGVMGITKRRGKSTLSIVAGGGETVALERQPTALVREIGSAIESAIAVR